MRPAHARSIGAATTRAAGSTASVSGWCVIKKPTVNAEVMQKGQFEDEFEKKEGKNDDEFA
jgi:hypothetical protein